MKRIKQLMVIISIFFLAFINSQLTKPDINYIKTIINENKDTLELFSTSDDWINYISIVSLKFLNSDVNEKPFCNELEKVKNTPSVTRIMMNELLNCGILFSLNKLILENPYEELNKINNIEHLFNYLVLLSKFDVKLDSFKLYDKVKLFRTKLMLYSSKEDSDTASLGSSSYALRILSILYKNSNNDELKKEFQSEIKVIIQEMDGYFQTLGETDTGAYFESNCDIFTLNRQILEAFEDIQDLYDAELLDDISYKILNYFLRFKHNITSLDKIYSLLRSFDLLKSWPILKIVRNNIFVDEVEERILPFKILDLFGNEDPTYEIEIKYFKDKMKSESLINITDNTDLVDDEDVILNHQDEERIIKLTNASEGNLNFSNISQIGKYNYILQINCIHNKYNGKIRKFIKKVNFRGIVKLKINYLSISVSNTLDKNDSKESKVDYPKRSFRNIKATQNSLIRIKIKLNTTANKLEQFFLRLKHNELNKGATGFSSEYNSAEGHHNISLDLSDHSVIEAYDGIYEMSILLCDPGIENPILWNFGKLEIKFSKPLDPLSINESFKNHQKPKIEHTFALEEHTKTSIASPIFTILISFVLLIYLRFLITSGINTDKFPKEDKSLRMITFLFIVIIILYLYFLFLFWIRFNILQTLFMIILTSIPSSIIIFKTIVSVPIDI